MRFRANTVRIVQIDGVTTLAFGVEGEVPSVGVLLSVSDTECEQDRKLGIDGIYFEAIHADVSGYHLVSKIDCQGRLVRIEMKGAFGDLGEIIEIEAVDESIDASTLGQTIEMMSNHVF